MKKFPPSPNDFEPRRKPSLIVEALAYVFIYGPIFTFFYVIIKGMQYLLGY